VIIATIGLALGALCFPLIGPGQAGGPIFLATGYFILSAAGSALTVYAWTIRQFLTPNHLLGKMNGAFRFWVTGVMPLGALVGGWLGSQIGIRSTLVLAATGILASSFAGVFSALRELRVLVPVSQPEPFR
jgi:hypothetical protein